MKKILFSALLCLFACSSVQAAETEKKINLRTIPAEDFLRIARKAPAQETWAKMSGKVQHRRTGAAVLSSDIRLGVRFTPARIIGQLVLDGQEFYNLGQTFADPPRSTRSLAGRALDEKKALLPVFGLTPDDLLLGFLYHNFVREDQPEKVSVFYARVLVMQSPETKEYTRVYISTDYAFPVKAEWFRTMPGEGVEPYRKMEIVSTKEQDGFHVITKLILFGDDWRTRIDFDTAEAGYAAKSIPADLFLKP